MGIKMNWTPIKVLVVVCFTLVFGFSGYAQEFKAHAVKKGETLESIAKQYQVTTATIIKYNKEISGQKSLIPNTYLVIPISGAVTSSTSTDEPKKIVQEERKPSSFTTYKVKRKDTLFGIALRNNVSEDDLKRYNKELYAQSLKKGMVLQIPKFATPKVVDIVEDSEDSNIEEYTVKAKETRWSVAHKYGITVDSLLKLNTNLSKESDYLAEGYVLQLPRKTNTTLEKQQVQLYTSYTVPAKSGFFAITSKYEVSEEEVRKLNPEIEEKGLQPGMVLRIPTKKVDTAAINTENFIFYEVKPKQNMFRLTRTLQMSYEELLKLNPILSEGLKAGMVLKLPRKNELQFEVKNALIIDRLSLVDSIPQNAGAKLLLMLPFRLSKVDFSNEELAIKTVEKRNDLQLSLGLYSGALVALDSLASLGVSVTIETQDTDLDLDRVKQILSTKQLSAYDAVVGPINDKALATVAAAAWEHNVPVFSPYVKKSALSLPNVFYTTPTDGVLREKLLNYAAKKHSNENILVIADSKNVEASTKIKAKFPNSKKIPLIEDLSIDIESFTSSLSLEEDNWVFVESDNYKLISSVTSILSASITDSTKLQLFTTHKGRSFEKEGVSNAQLSKLKFCYPSMQLEDHADSFTKRYEKRWGREPDTYAYQGFDVIFDAVLKLAYDKNLFELSRKIGEITYSGQQINYQPTLNEGFYNTSGYILQYDAMTIKEAPAPVKKKEVVMEQ